MANADSKTIQQINFTWNQDWYENTIMFFIIEAAKEAILDFLQGSVRTFICIYRKKRAFKYSSNSKKFKTFIKCGWEF